MPTVLIGPPVLHHQPGEYARVLEEAGYSLRYPVHVGQQMTEATLVEHLHGVDAALAGSEPYTAAVLERFPGLRVISRSGVGYDAVDVAAATRLGKLVAFTPGTNHDAVAEHTLAMLLAVAKQIVPNHQMVAGGAFRRRTMQPVRGRVLGVIGLGRIGRAVAVLAQAFGMKVLAFDPMEGPALPGVERVDRETLLSQSDYVTLHTPLTPDTRQMIRAETLARMKPTAVLINTARGGLVDEADLASALDNSTLAGAAIDVFVDEPPIGSPLLGAKNILFSPHIAGIDTEAVASMARMAAETIVLLHRGEWPAERLVNGADLQPSWRW